MLQELSLLTSRRILPLYITQFFGLFNDSLFKYTLIMFITFNAVKNAEHAQLIVNLIGGIYALAFLLFSLTVGQLGDKFDRVKIIIIMKFLEVVLIFIGMMSLYLKILDLSLLVIFLLGLHTAFLSPIKFSLLPDLLESKNLLMGNSLITSGSVAAILLGSVVGLFFSKTFEQTMLICLMALFFALFGLISSFFIPKVPRLDPKLKINFRDITNLIHYINQEKKILPATITIAWSIFIAVILVRQFPIYTKLFISEKQIFVLVLFGPFALGTILGAFLSHRIFKDVINIHYTFFSLFLMSLFLIDLAWTTNQIIHLPFDLLSFQRIRISFDIFLFSFTLGISIVPLFAYLQITSDPAHRARVLAYNNLLISLFAVIATLFVVLLIHLHLSITQIYSVVAFVNIAMIIYTFKNLR